MNKTFVPDWKLERYLLGELPADEMRYIRTLEGSDHELRGRIESLRNSDAEILERFPPEQTAKRIRNQYSVDAALSEGRRRAASVNRLTVAGKFIEELLPSRNSLIARAAFACVAVFAAIMFPMVIRPPAPHTEVAAARYEDRVKGSASTVAAAIEIWRKEGDAAKMLPPDAVAREGDVIQLRYVVPEQCYGALFSVDGRGVLTVHLSDDHGKAAALTPGRPVALKNSYELDDAPHYEVFYLVTADNMFDIDDAARSLRNIDHPISDGHELSMPQQNSVTAFTLRKSGGGKASEI